MPGVIDADTHIAESESMWNLIDEAMYPRRPVRFTVPKDTLYKERNAFWLIDGNIFPKPIGKKGSYNLMTPSLPGQESLRGGVTIPCRELTDIEARLADMDRLNIATQVIYPTLFLIYLTDDVELEIALCRAYNRWLAQAWSKSRNRLRWVAVLPLRSVEAAIEEMGTAKQNGAVGLFFRGIEGSLTLDNPHFFPIYQEASRLDLPICIHTGSGAPAMLDLFDVERNSTFAHNRVLPLIAFRDLVANKIPELFPGLRFGFIEASAGWIPYLTHVLRRLVRERWKHASSADLFREYRLYVACEADEDIPYIAKYAGEDHILIGSDYGHNDPSKEPELVATMRGRGDVAGSLIERILSDNPRTFYGL
jgi:predicted TIM-barrel fold metal-dependent hydrolase